MSTVRATNFQHASSSVANLTLASDGSVSGNAPWGGRNLLYNGAMQVAQRGTSTTGITTGGYYTADRWTLLSDGFPGTWTQDIQTDAPTGSGLRRSLRMLCTTAKSSLSASDILWVAQRLEGQDCQRIAKGTASAQQVTLSFWVKSNVTGTYVVALNDADNSRNVGATYTVSASATWEQKKITFPADTSGVLDNDNANSLQLLFSLAAGTSYSSGTLDSVWASQVAANRAVGQVNVAAATNNYWQITGVQLEVGPAATAFEVKPYAQELRECQRYYYRSTGASNAFGVIGWGTATSSTGIVTPIYVPVVMRTAPVASISGAIRAVDGVSALSVSAVAINTDATATVPNMTWTVSGATQFRPYIVGQNNDSAAFLALTAEL